MNNIPAGYDENGVRNGDGSWYEEEIDENMGEYEPEELSDLSEEELFNLIYEG